MCVILIINQMQSAVREPKYVFSDLLSPEDDPPYPDQSGESSFLLQSARAPSGSGRGSANRDAFNISAGDIATPAYRARLLNSSVGRGSAVSRGMGTAQRTPGQQQTASLVALVEGRGVAKGQIGMASLDLKSPELVLSQFPDTQTYARLLTKLQILSPVEIVLPATLCQDTALIAGAQTGTGAGTINNLYGLLAAQFPSTNVASVQRKYFNEAKGQELIGFLCVPEFSSVVEIELSDKYYCLACAAALLKYIEYIQNVSFARASLKVSFKGSDQTVMIDANTARNLELIVNSQDPQNGLSLFRVLNHTKTGPGGQMLRSNLLQPPCSRETIEMRLDCVQELTEQPDVFFAMQGVLARFIDVNRLLGPYVQIPRQESVRSSESKISYVIQLKHVLELVPPLRRCMEECRAPLTKAYFQGLADSRFEAILENISNVVHDDTRHTKGTLNTRTQKCFAVKPGINGMLDVARRTYTEIVDDISSTIRAYAEQTQLPMRSTFSSAKDFHIQLQLAPGANEVPPLPAQFIKVTKSKNRMLFTTQELIHFNNRVKESLNEIYLMTNLVLSSLMEGIRSNIGCLYKLAECVATMDMLVSLAHFCTLGSYTRPEFTDTLAVKQSRHPILDKSLSEQFVPNNIYASNDTRLSVITGPNMSGKSTYLCQIALMQVLAQVGCFVPAEYASFRTVNHVFTRMGSCDDIETNTSTFSQEMKEVNYILQNVTDCSLVLIDELGRGTSSLEGVGLCHAVCEKLLSTRASVFLVTHYSELTDLATLYPAVENYFFQVQHSIADSKPGGACSIISTHVLSKGKCEEKYYGLKLAELTCIPQGIISEARKIAEMVCLKQRMSREQTSHSHEETLVYRLAHKLIQAASNSQLDTETLSLYLESLKRNYLTELQSLC